MAIPVFHDDQHGTAITVAAAVRNGLLLQGKRLEDVRLVTSGAGAAAMACVDLLVVMGLRAENVTLTDVNGVVHAERSDLTERMRRYAHATRARGLAEVLDGADVFMGLSAPRVLKPEWLGRFADKPLILALANPEPEILPEAVRAARPDAIVATGRSDYPNQVNNVLCFPFIFRGALDVGATTINEAMTLAAVEAIVRPELHHPEAVRPAVDPASRARGGACRHGVGRRPPADRRFRRLPARTGALRLPLRPAHAPRVRARQGRPGAGGLCRRRGRARLARGAEPGR
jgi:malic enzyme